MMFTIVVVVAKGAIAILDTWDYDAVVVTIQH